MSILVLLRHGKSMWNKLNLFTGWVDVPLAEEGIDEALRAGEILKDYCFDEVYTSVLIRSIQTAMIALSKNGCGKTPIIQHNEGRMKDWANMPENIPVLPVYEIEELNERYYGNLQGLNKQEMAEKFGAEMVHKWRRSYDINPPGGESLKDNYERTIPFFKATIIPRLEEGKNILISAHGNSLRAIVKFIENISDNDIPKFEIPTGKPLIYDYKDGNFIKKSEDEND
ncbi:2,3-bisphosphoglycerate-dependent phosphoglycerate mutase [Hippea sp. KM1]|uniref:2,3-bisphosphoglycerate-dependent phosphoglycerate mutase n=1 Tax=Hippea sp. KM1 TaxID=944481 RepID=UPI00046D86A8|nr:2,3-bisphosphoglycerate-dependent phosphoglycerate mutase [Hippea sp. KM1]